MIFATNKSLGGTWCKFKYKIQQKDEKWTENEENLLQTQYVR